jgi:hypothetical protein
VLLVVHSVVRAAVLTLPSLLKTSVAGGDHAGPVGGIVLRCERLDAAGGDGGLGERERRGNAWMAFEMLAKAEVNEDTISPALPAGK